MYRINFHGSKDIQAIVVRLLKEDDHPDRSQTDRISSAITESVKAVIVMMASVDTAALAVLV